MAKKSVLERTQKAVFSAAKIGAEGVKDAASSALGAAASAATGVIVDRVAEALGGGPRNADEAATSQRIASANGTRSRRSPGKPRNAAPQKHALQKKHVPRPGHVRQLRPERPQSEPLRKREAQAKRAERRHLPEPKARLAKAWSRRNRYAGEALAIR